MSIVSIFSWIICGLIVGMNARYMVPGREFLNQQMTTILGVVGALMGGFLYTMIRGRSLEPFSLASHNWYGWIVASLGALFVVWIFPYVYPKKWWE